MTDEKYDWDYELGSALQHETTFAIKQSGRWVLTERPCKPSELYSRLAKDGLADLQYRIISHHHVNPSTPGDTSHSHAFRAGWSLDLDTGNWFPMEEELPAPSGKPVDSSIHFVLRYIAFGWLNFTLSTDSTTMGFELDDIYDSPVMYVRFLQLLQDGKFPHAALQLNPLIHISTHPCDKSEDIMRLVVEKNDRKASARIDILLERSRLITELRKFLANIAKHDALGHMYLFYGCLPDEEHDRISDEAEEEWRTGVEKGLYPDDMASEDTFVSQKLVEQIELTKEQQEYLSEYQRMLLSLEIPEKWLISHHLI